MKKNDSTSTPAKLVLAQSGVISIPMDMVPKRGASLSSAFEVRSDGKHIIVTPANIVDDDFAAACATYVRLCKSKIWAISVFGDTTHVVISGEPTPVTVCRHVNDKYDLNVAVAYAFAKAGYNYKNPAAERLSRRY